MTLLAFLNLIRWKNILLVIYVNCLIYFILFPKFDIISLDLVSFFVLIFCLICITAAGNIINDVFDVEADTLNKPSKLIVTNSVSLYTAKKLYLIMNSSGIILGVGLCLQLQKPQLCMIFIGTSLLLYYYSKSFKKIALLGNLIVSILVALSVCILFIFPWKEEISPMEIDFPSYDLFFLIRFIQFITVLAFLLTFLRELVKDGIDIIGDYKMKSKTLPIIIGMKRTNHFIAILSILPLSLILFISILFVDDFKLIISYLLFIVFLPLLYVMIKLIQVKKRNEMITLSRILKIIMFFGVTSILIFALSF